MVADKKNSAHAGRSVEEVGFYNPATKEKIVKAERIKYWMSVGAKPSATVHNLLISEKVIEGKKIPKHKSAKSPPAVAGGHLGGSASMPSGALGGKEGV